MNILFHFTRQASRLRSLGLITLLMVMSIAAFGQVPAITGFSPASGSAGTIITITGTDLGSPTSFTVGGTTAIVISNTGTALVGMVMPGSATGTIAVTTGGGTATSTGNFTVTRTPYPVLQSGSKLVGSGATGPAYQGYGVAVSADGTTAVVGGFKNNSGQGAVWMYKRTGLVWTEQARLMGGGSVGAAGQGSSVAISADGNTVIWGGRNDAANIGAVWIFIRSGVTWTQQAKLVAAAGAGRPYQGTSVALSADGNTAVWGGEEDWNGQGAVYVFMRNSAVWTEAAELIGTGNIGPAYQGHSVSISADGNTVMSGGYKDDGGKGAAWIFTRNGATWSQEAKLTGTGDIGTAYQGSSVALSGDGNTAISGGYQDNTGQGAAWIFIRNGTTWTQETKLVGTGNTGIAFQGSAVSLSADGSTAMSGGSGDNSNRGAAWIFTRSGITWTQQAKLVGTGYTGSSYQGWSTSLTPDGKTAISGGIWDNATQGAVWTFDMQPVITTGTITGSPFAISNTVSVPFTITGNFNTGNIFTAQLSNAAGSFATPVSIGTLTATTSGAITCTIPPIAGGAGYRIRVIASSPATTGVDNGLNLVIIPAAPVITSFSPASGPVGTVITINGTDLGTPTSFAVGGTTAIVISNTGTTLVGMVMPGAANGTVSLTTASGTGTGSSNFTVTPTPFPGAQLGVKRVGTGATGAARQGFSVAITEDGNTAIVGGPANNATQGAVWIYTRSGSTWTQQARLAATDNIGAAQQGYSVAISADGNTATWGGYADDGGQGAAWIFTRTGTTWAQQAKLVGTGNTGAAGQGNSVSISADGNTVIVGGSSDNNNEGAAWIYTRNGNTWAQQARLVGTGNIGAAWQGSGVAISADGNTAMSGGFVDNNTQGAAWIFTRSGNNWTQQAKLVGTGASGAAQQGGAVALSADGNTAMSGGYFDNSQQGAAWIFKRSGTNWTNQAKLIGTGSTGLGKQGWSVSLSADGNTAMSGGYGDNSNQGAAWIFTRNSSTWTQQTKLVGTGNTGGAYQGTSVSLTADGSTALSGGYVDNSARGAVWFFQVQPTIATGAISGSPFTTGNTASVPFTSTGIFNTGNIFTAQLSDAAGSFAAPVSIGTLTATTAGTITGTIPSLAGGAGYRIRVIASNPATTGTDNGLNLVLIPIPVITSFTPASGPVGTLITISGTGLGTPTAFTVGGIAAIAISNTGTTLVGMVMPGAASGPVSVTTAGGTGTSSSSFTVTPTPYPGAQLGNKLVGTGGTVTSGHQGSSVAISADGTTAIVGAYGISSNQGAVWIYTRTGATWAQQAKLVGTLNSGAASQGYSVSLSADGNTAIWGGYTDNSNQGAAWIFTRNGTTWTQQTKLVGTGNTGAANQGYSVSLSADGNTAMSGGIADNSGQGAAWIFTRSGTVWTQQTILIGTGGTASALQGASVSLSAEGNNAMSGGYGDNSYQGAAWIFTRSGTDWTQQAKLVGTGNSGAAYQGHAVSLSANGNTAISGGYQDNGGRGAAWIFTRTGTTWTQETKLVGTGSSSIAAQGTSVSLTADGNTAMSGGLGDNSLVGAGWVFTRSGTAWTQRAKVVGTGNTGSSQQGTALALSADGASAISGGPGDNTNIGAVWMFQIQPTIATSAITRGPFCAGSTISIPYTSTNTFNTGNVFTATLSNASGSFATPIATATGTSPITLTIPTSASSGTGYLVRVSASNPVTTGSTAGITINALPGAPVITATNSTCQSGCAVGGGSFNITSCGAGTTMTYYDDAAGTNPTTTAPTYNQTGAMTIYYACVDNTTSCASAIQSLTTLPGTCINPADPATPVSNTPQCAGTGVTMTPSGTAPVGETWYWQGDNANGTSTSNAAGTAYNAGASGIYYLRAQNDATQCWSTGSGSSSVIVNPLPAASIAGNNSPVCAGSDARFTIIGTSGATVTYNINNGGSATVLLTGGSAMVTVTGAAANQTLNLESVNDGTCSQVLSGSATVTVNPVPDVGIANNGPVCYGNDAIFTLSGTDGAIVTYHINNGSNTTTTLSGGAATITIAGASTDQTLSLVSITDGTCSQTLNGSSVITVNPLMTAGISDNGPVCSGTDAIFTLIGTSGTTVTYNINTGSNATATLTGGVATVTVNAATATQILNLISVTDGTCSNELSGSSTVNITTALTAGITGNSGPVAPAATPASC